MIVFGERSADLGTINGFVIIIHCTGINQCSLFGSNTYFKPLNIQNMN